MNSINSTSKPIIGTRDQFGNIAMTVILTAIIGTMALFIKCKRQENPALFVIHARGFVNGK